MRKINFKNQKGFTLIELMVVVAIISLLSGVVLASLDIARSKARDGVRYSDMKQIKNAIELYYSNNGVYPTCNGEDLCDGYPTFEPINTLQVVPTYIPKISDDPTNGIGKGGYIYTYAYARGYRKTGDNTYIYTGQGTDYIIGMRLENSSSSDYSAWGYTLNFLDGN
jgi:prepilin-type N-terminal cleavage/methylation domain-containing protein